MKTFLTVVIPAPFLLLVATGEYIACRILLPDMGLGVPDFWAVFWANSFLGLFLLTPAFIANKLSTDS